MAKKPLNYAVLLYMTTVKEACADDVIEALSSEYSSWKMFTRNGIQEILMTGEKNGLFEEAFYQYDDHGDLQIYYTTPKEGRDTIISYLK